MGIRINKKLEEIPPSGIRKFFDLISTRKDIISLGVGEPDFYTPWHIRESIIYSLEKGYTAYTSNWGIYELREAISSYYKKFGVSSSPDDVLITTGVSEGLDITIRGILNPGERVIIPEPCYVSYIPLVKLAYGNPVLVPTSEETGFKIHYEDIVNHSDPPSKAIILGYPSNPTGVTYSKKELEEVADAVIEKDMIVISDEIYAELTYDRRHVSIASLNGMSERVIILNGFSKAHAMTGLRIGYAIAPSDIMEAMLKIHQYCMLCAPVSAQMGAIEALKNGSKEVDKMRNEYNRRRKFFVNRLNDFLSCQMPEGAFYAFPSIRETGLSSESFSEKLLSYGVAVVPGTAFGKTGEGYIRCSYAVSMEKLKIAADRMEEFIGSIARERV